MGLFSKSVTDEEWLAQAKPLYDAALPYMTALNDAVVNQSPKDEHNAVDDALPKLPGIAQAIKKLPSPTSSEARRAKKNLEGAMGFYTEGIKQGARFFLDLGGAPGNRLGRGGISTRAAAGRLSFQKGVFESNVNSGRKYLEQATAYFSTR